MCMCFHALYLLGKGFSQRVAQAVLRVQAQAHYPLVDVFAVSSYLDDLAAECSTRIAASNANTDLEKLAILNQLMFNPPADGRYVAHTICPTPNQPAVVLWLCLQHVNKCLRQPIMVQ